MTIDTAPATIGERLARVARRRPGAVAVVEHDASISFGEFDAAASAIARRLVAAAHRAGCACLFFESKLPALQSIFGAARSGRTYVALDASDPDERLRFIVDDCGPAVLLTESRLLGRAHAIAPPGCDVVDVMRLPCTDDRRPLPAVAADAPVYLCYTSGSTGRPKGVIQTHTNLLFFVDAYARALAIGEDDRLSLLYTLSFNAANMDIFGGLLHGATLCAYDVRRDGVAPLANWLDQQRITVLHAVPTVFREMGKRLLPGRMLPYLRVVDLGGETVFASDVALFNAHTSPDCLLVNQLASTEVGLIAQHRVRHRDPDPATSIVPVGRCPAGVRVVIERADGSVADIDEAGEMVVCSAHVSPGYWRRPELDAAAFRADPLQPGWRRFASGDFGRIDGDGNLHFLGRKGGRVKIRGHSVDLMEVEAALSACPGVIKSVVLATLAGHRAESDRLVAHVVARDAADRDPQRLRRELATRLPAYMLPAGFVFVDALPLTASGKVDRMALATIAIAAGDDAREVDAPRDDVERRIAAIFGQLLAITPVGREDDFFMLGGDSLSATELQLRLGQEFGVRVGSFHADASVAAIAARVLRASDGPRTDHAPLPVLLPLWRHGGEIPLFLVHGRHGQAFVSPHFMQLLGNDQPVWVFQARGLDGLQAPHARVEDMAADYLAALRKERPRGPYFIGSLCAGAFIAAIIARTLREAGETVLPLLLIDPASRLLNARFAQMGEQKLVDQMTVRQAMGRAPGPVGDPQYMKVAARVALAFEQAMARYEPRPYDGPAFMLASRQRMAATDLATLRRTLSGPIEHFEVGATHRDALDARNPAFAKALMHCVDRIRVAAREAAVPPAEVAAHGHF